MADFEGRRDMTPNVPKNGLAECRAKQIGDKAEDTKVTTVVTYHRGAAHVVGPLQGDDCGDKLP